MTDPAPSVIRPASDDDVEALAHLLVLLYADELPGMLRGDADAQTAVTRSLVTIAAPPAADEAQIHSVVVDDRARGLGMGARIVRHLEREAAAPGKRRVVLQVLASNGKARAFYHALGYVEDGPAHGRLCSAFAFRSVLMHKDL